MSEIGFFPPAAFYFDVEIPGGGSLDGSFQEVSGIEVESDVEEINEGGQNDFVHRVPGRNKYKNLVLKRGLLYKGSGLTKWCKKRFDESLNLSGRVGVKDITVHLNNEKGDPIFTWTFHRAYPVKWSIGGFNSQENAVSVETIEFAFSHFSTSPKG